MGVCTHPRFACREQHLIYFDCPNLHWDEISIVMLCARFFLAKISFALGSNLLNNMPQGRLTVFVTLSNKPQYFVAKVLRFVVFLFPVVRHVGIWWSQTGSNRRPPACKAGALPAELWPLARTGTHGFWVRRTQWLSPQIMVGLGRLELPTPRLSSVCSNQLSYRPNLRYAL